ncbi:MAG: L,D-transpeptidase family protein [Solirubrobacteraceae bacterium]
MLIAGLALAPAASARKLTVGMNGVDVRHLQERLAELSYLPRSAASGAFDQRTWHAVVAFQGWQGMPPDGVAGPRTRRELRRATRPLPSSRRAGFEIHVRAQVLLIARNRRTTRAIHISSGAGGGTPLGQFSVYSKVPMSWSRKFKAWLPLAQYFNGGIALHQYGSVPAYAASHGCVRMPAEDAEVVWRASEIGTRVSVTADNKIVRVSARELRKRARDRHARTLARVLSVMSL